MLSPSCGLRCTKPVTFAICCAICPSGFMLRKSSKFGGRCSFGMVSEGTGTAGLGAGLTSGFLIGNSGNCAAGGGICCAGLGSCPGLGGVTGGGGGGSWGVACCGLLFVGG